MAKRAEENGVFLEIWSDEIAEKIAQMDLNRAIIIIGDGLTETVVDRVFPTLPTATRYLGIRRMNLSSGHEDEFSDLSSLSSLTELRALFSYFTSDETFDFSVLRNSQKLSYLSLEFRNYSNTHYIGDLTNLHYLRFTSFTSEIENNLSTINRLRELRYLAIPRIKVMASSLPSLAMLSKLWGINIFQTNIESLTSLDGNPSVKYVYANLSAVEILPGSALPSLSRLEILSTNTDETEVERFRKKNPTCQISFRPLQTLKDAVKKSTRIVITYVHPHPRRKREVTVTDQNEITQLIAKIELKDESAYFECLCRGDQRLIFFEGDRRITDLTFHHSRSLRWKDGWPGDLELTDESSEYLSNWLEKHGF